MPQIAYSLFRLFDFFSLKENVLSYFFLLTVAVISLNLFIFHKIFFKAKTRGLSFCRSRLADVMDLKVNKNAAHSRWMKKKVTCPLCLNSLSSIKLDNKRCTKKGSFLLSNKLPPDLDCLLYFDDAKGFKVFCFHVCDTSKNINIHSKNPFPLGIFMNLKLFWLSTDTNSMLSFFLLFWQASPQPFMSHTSLTFHTFRPSVQSVARGKIQYLVSVAMMQR